MDTNAALDGDQGALADLMKNLDPDVFVDRFILGRTPWIFRGRPIEYQDWKRSFAADLAVDASGVVIAGSAGLGASLNPSNSFLRKFREESDIDVAVVSSRHFDLAWRALQRIGSHGSQIPTRSERDMLRRHKEWVVFNGSIATDRYLPKFEFGRDWQLALDKNSPKVPFEGHVMKVRIYRDFESLRIFQERGVDRLRRSIETFEIEGFSEDVMSLASDEEHLGIELEDLEQVRDGAKPSDEERHDESGS